MSVRKILGLVVLVVVAAVLGALEGAGSAQADAVYHSDHIAVAPVGGAPLRSGFVENIHTNGPVRFAHEVYVLNGARPGTTYQVTLQIYAGRPDCGGEALPVQSVTVTTNTAGNGRNDIMFSAADAGPLRHATHGIVWTFSRAGTVDYATACTRVTID